MGAFDGYWIPGHGVIPRSYYRDKVEEAEATLREHAHLNSVRWYKVEEDE